MLRLRLTCACLLTLGLWSGSAVAQSPKTPSPKTPSSKTQSPTPKPLSEEKDEKWTSLGEADEPDEPPPTEVDPTEGESGNPYRPTELPPPSNQDEPEPADPNAGNEEPEVIAWMRKDWKPLALTRHVRAEMDVGLFDRADIFAWDVVAQLGFDDVPAFLDVDIPVGFLSQELGSDKLVMGNIVLGGHGGDIVASGKLGLWGGMLVAIPTTVSADDRSPFALASMGLASVLRGGIEAHRFAPLNVPIRVNLGLATQIYPLVYYRFEMAGAAWVSTLDEADRGGLPAVRGFVEFINDIEALSPWGPGLGLRLQAWVDGTAYDGGILGNSFDREQLAVEPYIVYRPPFVGPANIPVFARLGFLIPTDDGQPSLALSTLNDDVDRTYFVLRASVGGRF